MLTPVTGKRAFDNEDAQQSIVQRPTKRIRLQDEESLALNLRSKPQDPAVKTEKESSVKDFDHQVVGNVRPEMSSVVMPKSVPQHVKRFESLIHPKRHSPLTSDTKVTAGKDVSKS